MKFPCFGMIFKGVFLAFRSLFLAFRRHVWVLVALRVMVVFVRGVRPWCSAPSDACWAAPALPTREDSPRLPVRWLSPCPSTSGGRGSSTLGGKPFLWVMHGESEPSWGCGTFAAGEPSSWCWCAPPRVAGALVCSLGVPATATGGELCASSVPALAWGQTVVGSAVPWGWVVAPCAHP